MAGIQKRKSVSQPLRPERVDFFYFSPLQKQQQQVQVPQITNNLNKIQPNLQKSNDSAQLQSFNSFKSNIINKTNFETCSQNNSFVSISIELPKIKRKYLDDYLFLSNLGKGAYGRVQKLKDKSSGSIYAGKTLLKTSNSTTNKFKNKKLQRQIKIYQKLIHTNIPQLHHIYNWRNQYTLILQFAEGQNLHALLDQYPNQQKMIARVVYQILDALQYIHSINIVHHDIKPQNIMYDPKSQIVKIVDFGEATELNEPYQKLKGQGGTYAYFAPQYFENICSTKLDIWACGLILYYLLSGKIYFSEKNRQLMKNSILQKPVIFQGYIWGKRSPFVKDLILKMLQKDPLKRITASQAKNHKWIVQNTKDWTNPSKNLVKSVARSTKRSLSIQRETSLHNQRKNSCDIPLLNKALSTKKLSRFHNG